MGRHVLSKSDYIEAYPWFKASVAEDRAYRAGRNAAPERIGRHAAPATCGAYVLAAGKKHPCVLSLAEHESTPRHEHPLYGKWENVVFDLDKYRKRFVR